jgi:hypothetical protein
VTPIPLLASRPIKPTPTTASPSSCPSRRRRLARPASSWGLSPATSRGAHGVSGHCRRLTRLFGVPWRV